MAGNFTAALDYTELATTWLGANSVTLDDLDGTVNIDLTDADDMIAGDVFVTGTDAVVMTDSFDNTVDYSLYNTTSLGGASVTLADADDTATIDLTDAGNLGGTGEAKFNGLVVLTVADEFDDNFNYAELSNAYLGANSVTLVDDDNSATIDFTDVGNLGGAGEAKFDGNVNLTLFVTDAEAATIGNNTANYTAAFLGAASVRIEGDGAITLTKTQLDNLRLAGIQFTGLDDITLSVSDADVTAIALNAGNYATGTINSASTTLDLIDNTVTLSVTQLDLLRYGPGDLQFASTDVITIAGDDADLDQVAQNSSDYGTAAIGGASVMLDGDGSVSVTQDHLLGLLDEGVTFNPNLTNGDVVTVLTGTGGVDTGDIDVAQLAARAAEYSAMAPRGMTILDDGAVNVSKNGLDALRNAGIRFSGGEAILISGASDADVGLILGAQSNYTISALGGASVTIDGDGSIGILRQVAQSMITNGLSFKDDNVTIGTINDIGVSAITSDAVNMANLTANGGTVTIDDSRNAVTITLEQATTLFNAGISFAATDALTISGQFTSTTNYAMFGALGGLSVTLNDSDDSARITQVQYDTYEGTDFTFHNSDVLTFQAVTGGENFDGTDYNIPMRVGITAGSQSSSFLFNDVDGDFAFTDGVDTFTANNIAGVLVIDNFDPVNDDDVLDLSTFDLSNLTDNNATFINTAVSEIGEGEYATVRGNYAGGTFTYNSTGTDLLALWDANPSAGDVTMVGVVLTNTTALTVGTSFIFG
ncbi:beta strand repeat-containing protein [Sphingorhabdus wooponensis]|uniref:Uncharacterized protein n=1 Tax=Sphingorhabdus wooponensis TaxID=940136 RepID=A0A426RPI7_9SPHN|nr:hypothetical protein [Sphingorhabdus wooponensis]RRQ50907.1 hypothetical protein D7D48_10435 [Sphingorhabdus wooponensis]